MAFYKQETVTGGKNILSSEVGLILKTFEGNQSMATAEGAKKVIKAGSVYPSNATGAKGIVFEDVDMTDNEKAPISVIIAGRVIEANLGVSVNGTAKAELIANGLYFD